MSDLNDWFLSLPEARQNVLRDDKWVLAEAAFAAGKAAALEYKQQKGGNCPEQKKPGGCQLHNLHCGYPKCDIKD